MTNNTKELLERADALIPNRPGKAVFMRDLKDHLASMGDGWQNLVVVLPDDAEPLPHDLMQFKTGADVDDYSYGFFSHRQDQGELRYRLWGSMACDKSELGNRLKIIQRNGKPVIHQSQLAPQPPENHINES